MSQSLPVEIIIPIEPCAAVRPKVTRWNTYYPGRYGEYLKEVRAWLNVHSQLLVPEKTLLEVTAEFELTRPKSHYGTGRNKGDVKASAAAVPHQDVDNLAKGVLDAMSGVVYADDKQVVRLSCLKRYGQGRTVVTVSEWS